jgi:hypothetical protein
MFLFLSPLDIEANNIRNKITYTTSSDSGQNFESLLLEKRSLLGFDDFIRVQVESWRCVP